LLATMVSNVRRDIPSSLLTSGALKRRSFASVCMWQSVAVVCPSFDAAMQTNVATDVSLERVHNA
jgi:hypothetical protein